jgi:transcriptional regulator with XRE-family HTH domain
MSSMHKFVLERLQSAKGHWSQVAAETGLSKRTIEKIARREIEDPGVSHIETLAIYFQGSFRRPRRVANVLR